MKITRFLITPIVKVAFLVNSISAKMITFVIVNLLGRRSAKRSKLRDKEKIRKKV